MKKNLLRKYVTVSMAIVLSSFVLLGSAMLLVASKFWRDDKSEMLLKNASSVSALAAGYIRHNEEEVLMTEGAEMLLPAFGALSQNTAADIFITDRSGRILVSSYLNGDHPALRQPDIDREIVKFAMSGRYIGRGRANGVYRAKYFIVGVPLTLPEEEEPVAAVFAATSMRGLWDYLLRMAGMFFSAAMIAFAVSLLIAAAFAYRMVRPLRAISHAVKEFGSGNLSVRIPTVGEDEEIADLADSFNEMAESLSNSEGMRRSFIANVSHELKTPMTSIAGFIDGILDGTIPQSEQKKYLRIVSAETKRLSRLVRTMLDLSRIDNGEMKLSRTDFDIRNTIVETMLSFEQKIEERGLEIRGLDEMNETPVYGDPDMLYQVVYNLIENAVKFTNAGGFIQVETAEYEDRTRVSITNSGEGIAPEEIGMIFDRFYKTDKSRSHDKNGMGLGLYLVKTIVNLHGGEIKARSVVNEFCTFTFTLPRKVEPIKLKEGALPKEEAERGRKGGTV